MQNQPSKIKCTNCGSTKTIGTRQKFKCLKCRFTHDETRDKGPNYQNCGKIVIKETKKR